MKNKSLNNIVAAFSNFWFYFSKNKGAVVALVYVILLFLTAIFAPIVAMHNPIDQDRNSLLLPPFWYANGKISYLLGTDSLGRDILSRIIYGARLSLLIGCFVAFASLVVGVILGLIAGFFGKLADTIIMRITDILMAIPALLLAIAFVAALGPSLFNAMLAVCVITLPSYIRLVRSSVLVEKSKTYLVADTMIGASYFRQIFISILPNCMPPLIVQASLSFSAAVLDIAALGFLGLGAQPPTPEWGTMLADAIEYIRSAWWVVTFPGLAILITVIAFNLIGDGLRDVLDPKLKR